MDARTTVVAASHSPDSAAALRWAARSASRRDHDLRVVCPVGTDSRDLARVETDLAGAAEIKKEHAQQWVVDELDGYLDTLTVHIETPDQCVQDAVAAAARGTSVLVVGSAVDTSVLEDRKLTVVRVSSRGRTLRGGSHRAISA